jgi:hypothetical protein
MVAFRASLSHEGQQQLQAVLLARCSKFASRVAELEELTEADREEVRDREEDVWDDLSVFQVLGHNLGYLVVFVICSMFDKNITWTEQLSPLIGVREVQKLDSKLRSLNVTDIDSIHLTFDMFFPIHQQENTMGDLVVRVGSWAKVIISFF